MPPLAGETVVAPGAFPAVFASACSANVDVTTTEVDITGATVTFSTLKANAQYMCIGSFYFSMIAASTGLALGKLNIDGTNQGSFVNFTGLSSTPERHNLAQCWSGTLAAAGSHTFKLRGVGSAAVAAQRVNATHTTITVLVF